jgi:hypothetical protein
VNDFDDMIDPGVTEEERERLQHVHALLVQAGPPPELPASLEHGSRPDELARKRAKPKSSVPRRLALLAAALILLGIAFGVGFGTGDRLSASTQPVAQLKLFGTGAAPHGRARLDVLPNVGGNWPMTLSVKGLPSVSAPMYYVVWLVRHGQRFAPCGSFVVSKNGIPLTLHLTAPYSLEKGDTWIVTREGYGPRAGTRTTVLEPRQLL